MAVTERSPFEFVYQPWADRVAQETGIPATVVVGVVVCFLIGMPFRGDIAILSGVATDAVLALYRRRWQVALPEASTQDRVERRFFGRSGPASAGDASGSSLTSALVQVTFRDRRVLPP